MPTLSSRMEPGGCYIDKVGNMQTPVFQCMYLSYISPDPVMQYSCEIHNFIL